MNIEEKTTVADLVLIAVSWFSIVMLGGGIITAVT